MNSVCHPVGPPGPHAPRTPRRRPFLRSRFADLMESPACGPLWLTVCALAFVFGVCAESQGSHPSVGRLEKRVGRSPTSVPTHFLYGMEQQTSHVQPLFLLHVGCRWRWDPRVSLAEYSCKGWSHPSFVSVPL